MSNDTPHASNPDAAVGSPQVVLLPPTLRDGQAIKALLESAGIGCVVCKSVAQLCDVVSESAGVMIVSEEAVTAEPKEVQSCVSEQPVWSDIPVLVLSHSGLESVTLTTALPLLGNVSVVERPMRLTTFLSLVRSALRARERQFQVRDHLQQLHRNEQERVGLLESERSARSEAERVSRLKDEFLATLSHELRTPLNAILGWSQIIQLGNNQPADVNRGISVIERNARAQAQIIEDLLDMSRIISGKVRLDVKPVDLSAIVSAAVDTALPTAEAKGVRLVSVIDPLHGVSISGDASRLQQILWNLLSNAIKFTPKDGRVQVVLQRVNSHLELNVIDSGEGIKPEFLPYVFDRFRQADASTTRRHGGLGLGLSIVKQLVELHGGSVAVQSAGAGKGSSFNVTLPLTVIRHKTHVASGHRTPRPATPAPSLSDNCGKLNGLKVLVVDDEADARMLVQRLLEDCNATVTIADSAAAAIQLIEAQRFDVLISDIGMPGEDGYAFMQRVRALSQPSGRLPAIALTAYARAEDRVKAIAAGFQLHVSKPVDAAELITMVASVGDAAGRATPGL